MLKYLSTKDKKKVKYFKDKTDKRNKIEQYENLNSN